MKRLLLLTLVASSLGLASSALAQAAGPAGGAPPVSAPRAGNKVDRKEMQRINQEILAKLNLTPDQKAKIDAHEREMAAKLLELRKGAKGAKGAGKSEDVKEKVKALRKENQEFMKQTLTKDQLKEMMRLRREELKTLRSTGGTAPIKP